MPPLATGHLRRKASGPGCPNTLEKRLARQHQLVPPATGAKPARPLFAFQCQGGGHHCLAHGGGLLRDAYYTHDTSLPGCADALAGYRAATSPHYSCNCTGEHSYLGGEGGLRTGLEFQILSWVAFGLSALLAPLLGTVIDSIESKRIYCILVGCAGVGMLGSAVIAHNWVWLQLVDKAALVLPQLTALASWGWLCRDLAPLQRSPSVVQPLFCASQKPGGWSA